MTVLLITMMCFVFYSSHVFGYSFIQCPYQESECQNDINCGSSAMSKRAGYFCKQWPFYSGGFAECCDENWSHYTCTHSVYSPNTNNVFCDFWYKTQTAVEDELQLCDCKVNNDEYCTSWICATISGYDFQNTNGTNAELLAKLLLPNQIEIFGVHQCGFFAGVRIPRYCYKYDDFKTCYCVPTEDDNEYCSEWLCNQYLNNAKNDLSLNTDWESSKRGEYQNYWNSSSSSSAVDMAALSTKVSTEEYKCTNSFSNEGRGDEYNDAVDKTECVQWKGDVLFAGNKFSVMECGTEGWNSDTSTFTQDIDSKWNITLQDLVDSYSYKWQCHEKGMDIRSNSQFMNFYLSTLIWSFGIGFIGLFLIFCYMKYKYITLSSFFCVQGWFLFIFGSIAAVHGGFASFFVYFVLQFGILGYILYLKWRHRGKQPYGSLSQRYEFDVEESMSRKDAKL